MFRKLDEIKVLRDPIHGSIHVEYEIIWDCINSKEFQRLRRIRQLGGSFQVYHGAQHNRFAHSCGVYEIVRRMVEENADIADYLNNEEKVVVMLAGLLHDIGHFPFSHALERVIGCSHEEYTQRIIMEESEINQILSGYDETLPKQVASIIDHTHPNVLMVQMISGQLDADRMDYLLRDAFYSGTKYGEFDLERILRTLRVKDGKMVIKESGIPAVEDYIMARYQMYWQVYYHPVARSYELVLNSFFERLKEIYKASPQWIEEVSFFFPYLDSSTMDVKRHFLFDESMCEYAFNLLRFSRDDILRDLSSRLLDRRLFEYCDAQDEKKIERQKQKVVKKGFDPRYYFKMDTAKQTPYKPYSSKGPKSILALNKKGQIVELSKASVLVEAIVQGQDKNDTKIYFPKECV